MKNKIFTFKLFLTVTNLVLPAISGPAFLQTPHYIINIATNWNHKEPHKLWLPDIHVVEFVLSTFRTRNFITFLAWYFRGYCINRPALWQVNSTGLFLGKNFVCRFLIFTYRGHLQVLKVCDLKLLCLSQLCSLKDRKIKVGF